MHYHEDDVNALFGPIPYLRLAKLSGAKQYVDRLVSDGAELEAVLADFPRVMYEPLDQHYVLLRCLGSIGDHLVSDLCRFYTWRGVVWAAWTVALAPNRSYGGYLREARASVPHNQWLVDLALAEVEGLRWHVDPGFQEQVRRLRALLGRVASPKVVLRLAPTAAELERLAVERQVVREAYSSGGVEKAVREIKRMQNLREAE